jgi:hypothetical protein
VEELKECICERMDHREVEVYLLVSLQPVVIRDRVLVGIVTRGKRRQNSPRHLEFQRLADWTSSSITT